MPQRTRTRDESHMRIHIQRTRMATPPTPDGRIAVGYDLYVPAEDCADDGMNRTIILKGPAGTAWNRLTRYHDFPQATWYTTLIPGRERYDRWLEHEQAALRRMLSILHRACPEPRHLTEYPHVCVRVPPDTPMEAVEYEIGDPLFDPDAEDQSSAAPALPLPRE